LRSSLVELGAIDQISAAHSQLAPTRFDVLYAQGPL